MKKRWEPRYCVADGQLQELSELCSSKETSQNIWQSRQDVGSLSQSYKTCILYFSQSVYHEMYHVIRDFTYLQRCSAPPLGKPNIHTELNQFKFILGVNERSQRRPMFMGQI